MKIVIYFEKINYASLLLAIIFKTLFFKVYYRDTIFLNKNKFNCYLFKKIFNQINLENIEIKYFNWSYKIKEKLMYRVKNNFFKKNYFFKKYIKIKKFNHVDIEKFYLCLYDEFNFNQSFGYNQDISSYILIKKYFLSKNTKVIYFPNLFTSYILIKEIKNKNLFKIGFLSLINIIFDFFMIFIKKIPSKIKLIFKKNNRFNNSNKSLVNSKDYNLAFVPHKSFRYGNFFNKIFIYSRNKDSIFYKKKLLTIFFEQKLDNLTLRFLRKNKIPYIKIYKPLTNYFFSKNFVILFYNLFSIFSIKDFLRSIYFAILILRVDRKINIYSDHLKKNNTLKLIYVFFDIVCPKTFLFAANQLNIKTLSTQERLLSHVYTNPLFYDFYLTTGNVFKDILSKKNYLIGNYEAIGLPRTSLMKIKKAEKKEYSRLEKIKKQKKIIVCFGVSVRSKREVGLVGEDGLSLKSNVDFLNTIYNLAIQNLDHYYLIHYKMNNLNKTIEENLFDKFYNLKNFEITNENFSLNSYELSYFADLIIGRVSNINEELLSTRKKIIIYDNEKLLKTLDYKINQLENYVTNPDNLNYKVIQMLKQSFEYNEKTNKFIEDYLTDKNYIYDYEKVKKIIKEKFDKI